MDARFWADSSFPHDVLLGAGEGFGGKSVLDGLREAKQLETGLKGAGGGKVREDAQRRERGPDSIRTPY